MNETIEKRKTLFSNSGFQYSKRANEFASEAHRLLKPLFEQCLREGYSPRELATLIIHEVVSAECESVAWHYVDPEYPIEKLQFDLARYTEWAEQEEAEGKDSSTNRSMAKRVREELIRRRA